MKYRPEVDGLRSVAIVPVVLYHAGVSLFSGGFVGVDIFFVISGYLITGTFVDGGLSIADFYKRRIKRIAPALFVVTAATIVAGYLFLMPGDYATLAKSALATLGFVSNFFFLDNTGYFDAGADTMPLLHTWSLAIEEQFYIIWPALLVVLWRTFKLKGPVFWTIVISATSLSFAICVAQSTTNAKSAFFLPRTRFWELLVGASIMLLPADLALSVTRNRTTVLVAEIAAIACLAYAIFGLSNETIFPGYVAALPVVGSALIILASTSDHSITKRILSQRLPVFIGLISYSLYLWHWPILVFYGHYLNGAKITAFETSLLLTLIAVISVVSWRFIEQPFRRAKASNRDVFSTAVATAVSVGAIAGLVILNAGFPGRLSAQTLALSDRELMIRWECPQRVELSKGLRCVIGADWQTAKHHAVLWGDSHAQHFATILDKPAREAGVAIAFYRSCPPIIDNVFVLRDHPDFMGYSGRCATERAQILTFLKDNRSIDGVILAAYWSQLPDVIHGQDREKSPEIGLRLLRDGLLRTIKQLDPQRRQIVILGDIPSPNKPICLANENLPLRRDACDVAIDYKSVISFQGATNQVLKDVAANIEHVTYEDSIGAMCKENGCVTYIDGEYIYRDTSHLRHNLSPEIRKVLSERMKLPQLLSELRSH